MISRIFSFLKRDAKAMSFLDQHYNDVIMSVMASQITRLTIVYSTVYSGAEHRQHLSSASLAFVRGIHRSPVNSLHKGPVTRKMFPFDEVIFWWRHFDDVIFCYFISIIAATLYAMSCYIWNKQVYQKSQTTCYLGFLTIMELVNSVFLLSGTNPHRGW